MFARHHPVVIAHKLFEAAGGSNKRSPIIFLHGLLERKERWLKIPQQVADGTKRKVYAYDARNHGESEHTMDSSFDNNVNDLFHFMRQMEINKAVLVGHNMGGMTAIRATLQLPDLVEAAFIVDMHAGKLSKEIIHKYFAFMKTVAVKLYDVPDGSPTPNLALVRVPPPMEKLKQTELLCRSVMLFRALALMDALLKYEEMPEMHINGVYKDPAYFIYGSDSELRVDLHMDDIMKYFPNGRLIRFEGASSAPHLDEPDLFVKTIVERIPRDRNFIWF